MNSMVTGGQSTMIAQSEGITNCNFACKFVVQILTELCLSNLNSTIIAIIAIFILFLSSEIAEHYNIKMIPKLYIIQSNGEVVTDKGRKDIEDKGIAAFRGWMASVGKGSACIETPEIATENTIDNQSQDEKQEKTVTFQ